jgi:hypothetical protein
MLFLSTTQTLIGKTTSKKTGKGDQKNDIPCPSAVLNYIRNMVLNMGSEIYGTGCSSQKW